MSKFIDVYVLPVPKDKLDAYRRLAEDMAKVWRKHGALEVVELIAEDIKPGVNTSFPQAVKLEPHETVVVSWITFGSRTDRDRISGAVMKDPLFANMDPATMPVDGKRMFWGGFKPLVTM
jgi:uncharacterized protein YbaA (DUF1428 family)